MANKQNKKNKRAAGMSRKKRSLGSGHTRGYLYMSFSFLPILFPYWVSFMGFSTPLNSNLMTKCQIMHLRRYLYIKNHCISVSTYI